MIAAMEHYNGLKLLPLLKSTPIRPAAGEGRKEKARRQKSKESKDGEGGSVRLAKNLYVIIRGYWWPDSTCRI
jgi:hypothetical protein